MKIKCLLSVIALISSAFCVNSQVAPSPIHCNIGLVSGGSVQLMWESGPLNGLYEDFNDGVAQDFEFWTPSADGLPQYSYYIIDNGYTEIYSDNEHDYWGSGACEIIEFTDFTCEVEIHNIQGGSSRGILFRGDGPRDSNYNGYGFLYGYNYGIDRYSVVQWVGGFPGPIIDWTESDALNSGDGAINVLKVVGNGSIFDFYINGIYVDTDSDLDFSSGYVGFMQAPSVTAKYNYITCTYNAQLQDRSVEPQRGEQVEGWFDDAGRPMDHPPVMYEAYERQLDTKREILHFIQDDMPDEVDEFVEYRIYRNGVFIGATPDTVFTDQLPNYGEFEYRVTAFYDPEGESIPSVPATVNWQPVTYSLAGVNTVVPHTGGTITYDALLFNELPQTFQNASYRVYVTTPNHSVVGPVFQRNFNLAPGAYHSIPGMTQTIPAGAPPGNYFLHGRLYYQGQPVYEQTFQFDKMGGGD